MTRRRRLALAAEAERRNQELVARLGESMRSARRRRRLSQRTLGARAGVGATTVGRIERGGGAPASLDTWARLTGALGLPFRVELGRDPIEQTADAGHLAIQELLLRLGRAHGRARTFELATRTHDPSRSVDVCLRDDRQRVLILLEAWNRIDDIGAAARSTDRKVAEAEGLAAVLGAQLPLAGGVPDGNDVQDGPPYRVASAWVVRVTRRNRTLVFTYPEVFRARLPGSSLGWVGALAAGRDPPQEPGLVWCDVGATRLFAWRRG
jgi:transcriptional regulator with XRE-family HTH domain